MRRPLALLTAALLGITALVAPGALSSSAPERLPGWGKGLDYDIDRVRAAQAQAAAGVGDMPAELASYFRDKPAFFFHDRMTDHAEHKKPVVLHTSEADYPKMQAQLQSYLAKKYRAQAAAAAAAGEPMVFKVPTLLFQVNNTPFQEGGTAPRIENAISGVNTTSTGTVTEMYLEQSFGNMVVDFDAYGPYTVSASNNPGNDCHYGTDGAPVTGTAVGLGGGGAKGMAAEVVPQADPDVDFGQYDNDLDGIVDFLLIVHSGPDAAATGNPCHVWSHYMGPIAAEQIPTSDQNADGLPVGVSPVMTVPEIDLEIGVVAHELMHALGEPDYYGTAGTVGTGDWDLGAGASWSGIPAQTNPLHFNPVMKINFGWVKPRVVTSTARNVALRPRASNPDLVMVPLKVAAKDSDEAELCDAAPVGVPSQNNAFYTKDGGCLVEGFLVENINRASTVQPDKDCTPTAADFDRQAYGSGLMVWHWDFTNYESLGNDNVLRPMLDVEEFDRRDGTQELGTGVTRAQPLDVFWGDPVGMSGATQTPPGKVAIAPPAGSPWTVTGVPSLVAAVPAEPQPTWTIPTVPTNIGMTVDLEWANENDDWDFAVDRLVGDEWVEVGDSAGSIPQTSESVTVPIVKKGEQYRARATNFLATSPTATVSVSYSADAATLFGSPGTRTADNDQTAWAFTNIRPNSYRGIAHAAEQPKTPIVLDFVKHTTSTVDVSGDFVRPVQASPAPVVAGVSTKFSTMAYNHGGKPTVATVAVFDRDPAANGRALWQQSVSLKGFERKQLTFAYTPKAGLNELFVRATTGNDVTPGNDIVRTEVTAYPRGGSVLIVDNDFGWTQEQAYEAALKSLGISYQVVEGEPDLATLKKYRAVIWVTTTASGAQGVLSTKAAGDIAAFLEAGKGKLWMASTRVGGYADAEWLGKLFGLQVEGNLLNSMGVWRGTGDAIAGKRQIAIEYLDGRPYLDYGTLAENPLGKATQILTHNYMPEKVFATKVAGTNGFRTVFGVPIGLIRDGGERVRLSREILAFLGVNAGRPTVPATLAVHTERFQHVQVRQSWPVTVGAFGPDVRAVEMVYRPYAGSGWSVVRLAQKAPGVYSGVIPASKIGNQGLQYYVRVIGSGGKVTEVDGGSRLPNVASAPYGTVVEQRC